MLESIQIHGKNGQKSKFYIFKANSIFSKTACGSKITNLSKNFTLLFLFAMLECIQIW